MTILATFVTFIALQAGPAEHFAAFAETLKQNGYEVEIFASGPAIKKFEDRKIKNIRTFSLETESEEAVASALAEKSSSKIIITDVGHSFDITLHQTLERLAPEKLRFAYYDNPEPFVSEAYDSNALKVMNLANKVLFANSRLVKSNDIPILKSKREGIGYYPVEQGEKIAKKRADQKEKEALRKALFAANRWVDHGEKILVFVGSNNEEFFKQALINFLEIVKDKEEELSSYVILYQQHPGAKAANADLLSILAWKDESSFKKLAVSKMATDDALSIADVVLYYQTSMGPQFILSGIPVIQVSHKINHDLLVKNGLAIVATNDDEFIACLKNIKSTVPNIKVIKGLGYKSSWSKNLMNALEERHSKFFLMMGFAFVASIAGIWLMRKK